MKPSNPLLLKPLSPQSLDSRDHSLTTLGWPFRSVFFCLALLLFGPKAQAQNGALDVTFNTGAGPNALVNVVVVQPDGHLMIGGNFSAIDGVTLNRVARLFPNGAVDMSFDARTGANDDVRALAVQADGSVVVGGDFTTINGASRRRLARLLPDGRMDYDFDPLGADGTVHDIVVQPDGRVVVVGNFTEIGGVALNRVARLNTDGTLNTSFDPGSGANGLVRAAALQGDGKIVIGGDFTAYDGLPRNRIARLNADGSLDATFVVGSGMNQDVYDVVVDGSGRIIAGGQFTQVNGTTQRYMARLTASGGLDPLFSMALGFNNTVHGIALQPDGRIIAGGAFTTVNQVSRARVARLNDDASVDLTFDPAAGPNSTVFSVAAPRNGNVLIGGQFSTVAAQTRRYLARLTADGGSAVPTAPQIAVMPAEQKVNAGFPATFTVVASGSPPVAYQWKRNGVAVPDATSSILILPAVRPEDAGDYIVTLSNAAGSVDSAPVALVVLPEAPQVGSIDFNFNAAQGPNGAVRAMAIQPDGRILIGGSFATVDGQPRSRAARLLTNGSVDSSFAPLTGASDDVLALALLPDGRVFLGGEFLTYNGAPRARIARILADGALDPTFLPGVGANNIVDAVAAQPDGRVIIGGLFTSVGGEERNYLARLNADGSVDGTFNPPSGANGRVRALLVLPNGKVVVGGDFTRIAGGDRNRLAQLNSDGSLDEAFVLGTGFNQSVNALTLLKGNVLVGGSFTTYRGVATRYLALLDDTGAPSPTLDTLVGFNNVVHAVGLDPDENVLAAGTFTTVNNVTRNRVVRLRGEDGSVDTRFDPAGGPNTTVYAIAAQSDGKVVIGGAFTTIAGQARRYVARLNTDPRPQPQPFRLDIRNTDDGIRVDLFAESGFEYTIQRSYDLKTWELWKKAAGAGLTTEVRLLDPDSKTRPQGAYRAVYP
jgi:uncharacterized delta-60 repeat protein